MLCLHCFVLRYLSDNNSMSLRQYQPLRLAHQGSSLALTLLQQFGPLIESRSALSVP